MIRPATGAEPAGPPSALMQVLAVVMFVAPAAGIAWHAFVYLTYDLDAVIAYGAGPLMAASAMTAAVLVLLNWFHYRHTRMKMDLVSRVLAYLWIISAALLWLRVRQGA